MQRSKPKEKMKAGKPNPNSADRFVEDELIFKQVGKVEIRMILCGNYVDHHEGFPLSNK